MKKALLILGILIILAGLAGLGYWYWQSWQAAQTVTLDRADIDSFEDVCTGDDYLSCEGNINQFGCYRHRLTYYSDLTNLLPAYPIIECYKNDGSSGVYSLSKTAASAIATTISYVIIRDNNFQLIDSIQKLQETYAPISTVAEARDYFIVLNQANLVESDQALDSIRNAAAAGTYYTQPDQLKKSEVIETADGYIINAYSTVTLGKFSCANDLYVMTYLLERGGTLSEQTKTLVWEINNPPKCTQ